VHRVTFAGLEHVGVERRGQLVLADPVALEVGDGLAVRGDGDGGEAEDEALLVVCGQLAELNLSQNAASLLRIGGRVCG
jgi:hypothetical protein